MEEYASNSYKSKSEANEESTELATRHVEKVISGSAKVKKKNFFQRIASNLLAEERKNVEETLFSDVIMPAIRKVIVDIGTTALNMIFYGDTGTRSSKAPGSKVSYRSYYEDESSRKPKIRTGYEYDDIILDSRSEAEEVLVRMDELVDRYGVVSIADLYDLVGIVGNHTDNKYGWTNISNASVVRTRDGFLIKMPRATPL